MLILQYLLTTSVVTLINIIPAFMPETWVVLSFFYLHYHLSFIVVVLIGTIFGTIGRLILAQISRKHLFKIVPTRLKANYQDLGILFSSRRKSQFSLLLVYTFLPLPESQVFIAAGLAGVDLKLLAVSSVIRNLIVYSFWIKTASITINSLQSLFNSHGQAITIILNLISFSLLVIIGSIPWGKLIKKDKPI